MSQVVVVGAGIGGLAAAARLATLGHDVTVCEQSPVVGGKLGLLERDGYRFDTGPSLLTMPHVFEELFADTGDPLGTVLDLRPVDPIARYRFADGTALDATGELDVFCDRLDAAFGPGNGDDWRQLIGRASQMWAATRGPFVESALGGPRDLLRRSRHVSDLRTVAPWRTLRGLGRTYLRDPRLRMFLDRYATYTGSDPRRAPAALAVIPYVEQVYGAWYVEGGMRRLADTLADRAADRGTRFRLGTDVTAVTSSGGRTDGVETTEGRIPADIVVADADATHVYGDLVSDPRANRARQRLATAPASLSGFALLLGVGPTPGLPPGPSPGPSPGPAPRTPGLAHHTVLFPADYKAEFRAVFDRPTPVPDPTLYVSVPDDPAVAPPGCEAWFVLVNAPRQGTVKGSVDWTSSGLAEAYAHHLLELLALRGLDVRDRVRLQEVRTPADLERDTRSPGGAIYGSSSNGARAAFLRPANRSPVPGLFLVGGSSHPGGGLPLVALSARIVAGLVGPA